MQHRNADRRTAAYHDTIHIMKRHKTTASFIILGELMIDYFEMMLLKLH